MEKTIQIDGQDIVLEAKAKNLLIYESQFGEDALPVMGKVVDAIQGKTQIWEVGAVNTARLVWAMAKTHDAEFPDFEKWFDSLDAFPVIEIFNAICELVSVNLITNSDIKPKKVKRAED